VKRALHVNKFVIMEKKSPIGRKRQDLKTEYSMSHDDGVDDRPVNTNQIKHLILSHFIWMQCKADY
jgi:hypothetical protein